MVSEKQADKVHTNDASLMRSLGTQIWVVLRVGWKFCLLQPIRSSTQIWVVTHHCMEFLRSFLRHHFTGKPAMVSHNVGWFLRLSIYKLNVIILLLHGSHRPWRVLENWKIVLHCINYRWKVLEFSTQVLEYIVFLKAPWIKITFVKKGILPKGKIASTAVCKFSWWSWECVFLWFQCSRHSSFSVIWSTLGILPSWGKVLQLQIWQDFTSCHSLSNYRERKSLGKCTPFF